MWISFLLLQVFTAICPNFFANKFGTLSKETPQSHPRLQLFVTRMTEHGSLKTPALFHPMFFQPEIPAFELKTVPFQYERTFLQLGA